MQTFLPLPSYIESARSLDTQRLNKQKVECFQIYNAAIGQRYRTNGEYVGPAKGWLRHPAVLMWKEYPYQLLLYSLAVCKACREFNIADKSGIEDFFFSRLSRHEDITPYWITDKTLLDKVTYSHRANLIRKDSTFYAPKFPDINPINALSILYFWPGVKV